MKIGLTEARVQVREGETQRKREGEGESIFTRLAASS